MNTKSQSLYETFRAAAVLVETGNFVRTYSLNWNGQEYRVFVSRIKAGRLTEIDCPNNVILYRKKPWNGWLTGLREKTIEQFRFQIPPFEPGFRFLFLIPGVPGVIRGLDEGIFLSCHKPMENGKISVMTERAFKTFCPDI